MIFIGNVTTEGEMSICWLIF